MKNGKRREKKQNRVSTSCFVNAKAIAFESGIHSHLIEFLQFFFSSLSASPSSDILSFSFLVIIFSFVFAFHFAFHSFRIRLVYENSFTSLFLFTSVSSFHFTLQCTQHTINTHTHTQHV